MLKRYTVFLLALVVISLPVLVAQEAESDAKEGKGYLGVMIQDVSKKIEKRFKAPNDEGAFISEVVEDSPAEKSGLKEDDIVLSFGGKAVYDADDLSRFVQRTKPDEKADLVVWRDGAKKTLSVTLGKKKERSMALFSGSGGNFTVWSGRASYGMEISTLTEQLGEYFDIPGNEGVLVESVKKDGAAEKAGFKAGDVITKVGKEKVRKNTDVLKELSDYEEGDEVDIEVYRKGSSLTITLEVEESEDDAFGYFFRQSDGDERVVVAPRTRMRWVPRSDIHIDIDKLHKEGWKETQEELKDALEDLKKEQIRIRKVAPRISVAGKRLKI